MLDIDVLLRQEGADGGHHARLINVAGGNEMPFQHRLYIIDTDAHQARVGTVKQRPFHGQVAVAVVHRQAHGGMIDGMRVTQ